MSCSNILETDVNTNEDPGDVKPYNIFRGSPKCKVRGPFKVWNKDLCCMCKKFVARNSFWKFHRLQVYRHSKNMRKYFGVFLKPFLWGRRLDW